MVVMRVAVVGHAEHVTVGRVPTVPRAGEIVHLAEPRVLAGGGGGLAFLQLTKSAAELHLFTALGDDEAAAQVRAALDATGAHVHAARRATAHTRVIVMISPDGERTIVVLGEPLHPLRTDPLPWDVLATCDAAYFTAEDPEALRAARRARRLVVTARRRDALARSGVRADVIVGSAVDPREVSTRADYAVPPDHLVLTEGAAGGRIETASGTTRFTAPRVEHPGGGAYGAGDAFAAALTFFLAAGTTVDEACARAATYGAAMVGALDPTDRQLSLVSPESGSP
jgi:ribokinase